jgi:hypothetical protein
MSSIFTKMEEQNLINVINNTTGTKHDGFASLVSRGILCGNPTSIERFINDSMDKKGNHVDSVETKIKNINITRDDNYNLYVDTLKDYFTLFSTKYDKKEYTMDIDEGHTSAETTCGIISTDDLKDLGTTDTDKNQLIDNYCVFMIEHNSTENVKEQFDQTISSIFNTTTYDLQEHKKDNGKTMTSFMLTVIFCWDYSGKLLQQIEKKQKGGMFCPDNSDSDEENKKEPGGSELVPSINDVIVSQKCKHNKRIMITIALIAQIFFLFLLFENFRLLFTTIESIIDVGTDFNNETGHTVLGFFDAAKQILFGNMVNTLTNIKAHSTDRLRESIMSVAVEGQRAVQTSYIRGFATAANDYLTGATTTAVMTAAKTAAHNQQQILLQEGINSINVKFDMLTSATTSLTYGIINGIQGLMTSSLLLLHTLRPDIVDYNQITQAMFALSASFTAPTSYQNMVAACNNARLMGQSFTSLLTITEGVDTEPGPKSDNDDMDTTSGGKRRKRTKKGGKRTQKKKKGGKKKRKRTQKKKKGGKRKSTRKRK